jgi:Ion transport protein
MHSRDYANFGITNFDNIGTSLLTVFQIVTSDTWYQQICNLMDVDIPLIGAVYALSIIIVGMFFLMNLILAVIIYAFIKSQKIELEKELTDYHLEEEKRNSELKLLEQLEDEHHEQEVERISSELRLSLQLEDEAIQEESKQGSSIVKGRKMLLAVDNASSFKGSGGP